MIRFLRALKFLLRNPWFWQTPPEWTDEDRAAWLGFIKSNPGLKLSLTLRAASMQLNGNAVASGDTHTCGRAAGFMEALQYLESLSRPAAPKDGETSETTGEGAPVNLDHLAP